MYYTESRHDLSTQNPFFAQKYRKETAPAVSFVLLFFCILRHDAVVGIPRQLVHDGIQHREHREAHRRCADQQPAISSGRENTVSSWLLMLRRMSVLVMPTFCMMSNRL